MSDDWLGHDPDVLESLAVERNGLAWQRTSLSWVAAGATVARYFAGNGLLTARASIGYLMLAIGALIWFDGYRTYHRHAAAIRADQPTPASSMTLRVVSWATTLVIAAVVAVEVVSF
jgi:uncharacterized membrane protein YidH (DUF202 family)